MKNAWKMDILPHINVLLVQVLQALCTPHCHHVHQQRTLSTRCLRAVHNAQQL